MSTLFGDSPEYIEGQREAEVEAQTGELQSVENQVVENQSTEHDATEVQQETIIEERTGEQENIPARQEEKVLGKFNNHEEVAKSLDQLGNKLGEDVDWDNIQTEEELESAYQEAERKLGRTSDIDNLRKQNSQYENQLTQMQQYMQSMQQQMQSMQQGQPNQEDMQQQEGQSQVDPDEWLHNFYEKGPEAVEELVEKRLAKERETQKAEMMKQQAERQKLESVKQGYQQQINQIKNKYGQDFENHRQEAANVMKERPYYAYMSNGLELALLEAKNRSSNNIQQQTRQNQQQQVQAKNNIFKQGARLPQGNANRVISQNASEEDLMKKAIFQGQTQGGIFG